MATVTEQPKEETVVSYRVNMQADVAAAPFFAMYTSLKYYFAAVFLRKSPRVWWLITAWNLLISSLISSPFLSPWAILNVKCERNALNE